MEVAMPSYILKRCSTYPPEIDPMDPPFCLPDWLAIGLLLWGHLQQPNPSIPGGSDVTYMQ